MSENKKISVAVIKRLPKYYRYLGDLLDKGILKISSEELSKKMNTTASQVRQDLNNFGTFGQQGYGYNVENLYKEIKKILGLVRDYRMIIIGAGNIGQAILSHSNFSTRGFYFDAIFDIDPLLIGKELNGIKVFDIFCLKEYMKGNRVDIVVLTVPNSSVIKIVNLLENSEIKGIWNFTGIDLPISEPIVVENARLTDSLMTLSYRMNEDNIMEWAGIKSK